MYLQKSATKPHPETAELEIRAPSKPYDAHCHTNQPSEEHYPLNCQLFLMCDANVSLMAGFIYQWSQQETPGDFMWFVTSTETMICKVTKVQSRCWGFPLLLFLCTLLALLPGLDKRKESRQPPVPADLFKCHMCTLCCPSADFSNWNQ